MVLWVIGDRLHGNGAIIVLGGGGENPLVERGLLSFA